MKLLTFLENNNYSVGVKTLEGILNLTKAAAKFNMSVPTDIMDLIREWQWADETVEEIIMLASTQPEGLYLNEDSLVYGPCVTNPEK